MLQWRAFAMALTLVTEASLMFLWRCSYIWIERSDTPDSYARSCWVFLSFFLANASLVCLDAFSPYRRRDEPRVPPRLRARVVQTA